MSRLGIIAVLLAGIAIGMSIAVIAFVNIGRKK